MEKRNKGRKKIPKSEWQKFLQQKEGRTSFGKICIFLGAALLCAFIWDVVKGYAAQSHIEILTQTHTRTHLYPKNVF